MNCYLAQQRFDEVAKTYGEKTALYFQQTSVSYVDLYLSTNQLARSLRANGIQRGERVAIILPKSIDTIRAIFGTLKADSIYVPIDFKAPPQRVREIIEDCSPSGIICDRSVVNNLYPLIWKTGNRPATWVLGTEGMDDVSGDFITEKDIQGEEPEESDYLNTDRDLAYILYTSGSTGKPKGVMISHLNIYNYINWARDYFQIHESDNVLNTSHFYYDMSTFDVYCPLHSGASLTIVPERALLFPGEIMKIIEHRGITVWKGVSSLFAYIVKMRLLKPERITSLRKIIFSGESLPAKYLMEWMRTYPEKEFYNAYGPTECTGISTCYKVVAGTLDAGTPIPIGKACANSEVFSLIDGRRLTQPGEVGELYIRGSSVGLGYWNDPEKTQKSFVRHPLKHRVEDIVYRTGDLVKQLADGNYVFLGREDFQIKHMGHRIELGEIEYALQGVERVRDAAVVVAAGTGGETQEIVAFIETDGASRADEIREALKTRLPQHMMPTRIVVVNQIRRLQNGKIDREYLKHIA